MPNQNTEIRGDRLIALREFRGFTQGQVALRSGVNQSLISRIERGIRRNVYVSTVASLADSLGTTTDYLLGLTANARRPEDSTSPQTELEWQLLDKFRDLSFDEQRYIIAQLDLMLDVLARPAFRVIGGKDDGGEK